MHFMTQQTYSETISGKIRKFPRGQINRFAANNEYTRNNHRILLYMEKMSFPNLFKAPEGVHSILYQILRLFIGVL